MTHASFRPEAEPNATTREDDVLLPEIVMFFIGADGEFIPEHVDELRPERPHRVRPTTHGRWPTGSDNPMTARLYPGARVGQGFDPPRRSGFPEEILVTLDGDPISAAQAAVEPGFFQSMTTALEVQPGSLHARRNELRWTATLQTWPWSTRHAHLRLYGSPSANVTVLTLSPLRPHRVATRSFLRVGMKAMTALRDGLAQRVPKPRRGRGPVDVTRR